MEENLLPFSALMQWRKLRSYSVNCNLKAVLFCPLQKCVFCSNTTSHGSSIPPKPSFMVEKQNKLQNLIQASLQSPTFSSFGFTVGAVSRDLAVIIDLVAIIIVVVNTNHLNRSGKQGAEPENLDLKRLLLPADTVWSSLSSNMCSENQRWEQRPEP